MDQPALGSQETKKVQLLSNDQRRVQTNHETKLKELEEEKERRRTN